MKRLIYLSGLLVGLAALPACKGPAAQKSKDTPAVSTNPDTNYNSTMNAPVAGQDTSGRPMPAGSDTGKKHKK